MSQTVQWSVTSECQFCFEYNRERERASERETEIPICKNKAIRVWYSYLRVNVRNNDHTNKGDTSFVFAIIK